MADFYRRKHLGRGHPENLARGLGWLSIGLGVAQILAPRTMSRLMGVPVPSVLTVICGMRELACGVGLLSQEQAAPWLRARVAGDALDLAALGAGALLPGAGRGRIGVAAGLVGALTVTDLYCLRELSTHGRRFPPRHETLSIEVDRTPEELYGFWRDLPNLPQVMPHLKSVQVLDATRSHWVAAGPAGTQIEWDSEIIDDRPNERIAWRSLDGSTVFNAGSVQFQRATGGTRVRVELLYELPAGTLGEAVAKLFGKDPSHQTRADLGVFKRLMEDQSGTRGPRLVA